MPAFFDDDLDFQQWDLFSSHYFPADTYNFKRDTQRRFDPLSTLPCPAYIYLCV